MTSLFQQSRSLSLQALVLVAICISLMVLDQRFQSLVALRTSIGYVLTPIQYLVSLPAQSGQWVSEWFRTHTHLVVENSRLNDEALVLQARLQRMSILQAENQRLRQLLGSSQKVENDVVVAELLAVDHTPYRQLLEINKGSKDGIRNGLAVIDSQGIMGQVVTSKTNSASVILISDPEHAIPVQFVRSGIRAVAFGTGSIDQLQLRYLSATADIQLDDLLVSSGLGGRFPPDYPVARVSGIELDQAQGFVTVQARPMAQLSKSREVLVIQQAEGIEP